MTDSTDKKSKKIKDQDNQHEGLHQRLNSIDKEAKDKSDKFDVDLDAMLDRAESSFTTNDAFQDDEDAIDRLLVNADFDTDDALFQAEVNKDVNSMVDHDELDDFLSFDDFGEDFSEAEKAQTVGAELGGAVSIPLNDVQDDEDELDRLVMNTALDTDYTSVQAQQKESDVLEELDSFSDFSDFVEPEIVSAEKADELMPSNATPRDELDDFLSSLDDFNESDMILDDEVDASISVAAESVESSMDEELDMFSDFSDFNEPNIIPTVEDALESDQSTENLSSNIDDTALSDEVDDFFRFDELEADSDIRDEVSIPVAVGLNEPTEDKAVGEEEDIDAIGEPDGFSDLSVFSEPEIVPAVEIEKPEQATDSPVNDGSLSDEFDEFADFDGFGEDFDESDMIQDDEVEASANLAESDKNQQAVFEQSFADKNTVGSLSLDDGLDAQDALEQTDDIDDEANELDESDLIQDNEVDASSDLIVAEEELPIAVEESVSDFQDDGNSFNNLFTDSDFGEDDVFEQAKEKDDAFIDDTGLLEVDDFSSFGDDFNESDLIQDDEVEALADSVVANEELPVAFEALVNDAQDDEDSFNSLFANADFGEEDTLEQAEVKKDEFGDDASLSEIDSFFQFTEDNDDFSVQAEDGQLTGEKSLIQDEQVDDFLLPDFDITANTELSDSLVDDAIKGSEFTDDFGNTDFLGGDEVVPTSDSDVSGLKSGASEAIVAPIPEPEVETAVKNIENVKLNPFDFELDDLKKQLEEAENKVKKAKRYSYMAMGFGAVALSAAAGLGIMTYGAKTEVSKLTEAVATLETNLAKSVTNTPSQEINAMRDSVVSLNKQVDGFITELKENSQFPSDLLNNKVPNIVAKQEMVSKALDMLQIKVGNLEEKVSLTPSFVEPPKVEADPEPVSAPVKEENVHEIAPAKVVTEHEQVKSIGKHDEPHDVKAESIHEPAPVKNEVVQEQAPSKDKSASEIAPVKAKPEVEVARPIESAKPVVEEKPVKISKPAVIGKWGVNLVAFKQEWFAKSKAAEFARLGVFAEVIPVYEKGATMYRLRVGGFKSKAEANSNTAKIKRRLNLDSVWVSDN